MNFGITISSSLEGAYARLKNRLPLSIGDLVGVIKQTNDLIRYQVEKYEFDIVESINYIVEVNTYLMWWSKHQVQPWILD